MNENENDPLKKKQQDIINEAKELIKRGKPSADKSGIVPLVERLVGCAEDETMLAIWMEMDDKGIPFLVNMTIGNVTIHIPPCILGGATIGLNEATLKVQTYIEKNLGDEPTL